MLNINLKKNTTIIIVCIFLLLLTQCKFKDSENNSSNNNDEITNSSDSINEKIDQITLSKQVLVKPSLTLNDFPSPSIDCQATNSTFYALNPETNKCYWALTEDVEGYILSNDTIFFISPATKDLKAIDIKNGNIKWTSSSDLNLWSIYNSFNQTVFAISNKNYPDNITYAFDSQTGSVKWAMPKGYSEIGTYNDKIIARSSSSITLLSSVDGSINWGINKKGRAEDYIIHENQLFINFNGPYGKDENYSEKSFLYAINLDNQEIIWSFETNGSAKLTIAPDKKIVFLQNSPNFLSAINKETGEEIWKNPIDDNFGQPVSYDNYILYYSSYSNFNFANALTGDILWSAKASPTYRIIIANDLLVLHSSNTLSAYNIANGELAWQFTTDHNLFITSFADNKLYVSDGLDYYNQYIINSNTGELLQKNRTNKLVISTRQFYDFPFTIVHEQWR
jgi:outer membrane protein assembly factor BamB